jgi:hypothetical protein
MDMVRGRITVQVGVVGLIPYSSLVGNSYTQIVVAHIK